MQAKDLVVTGDARILGHLYVEQLQTTQSADVSAPRSSKLVPQGASGSDQPTQEGEIYWYYGT